MKKVLFTATVDSHIELFHLPYLKYFKENGYEVHVATNGDNEIPYCDKKIKIPFDRSPFKISNLKAIKQLKKVIMEEKYDIIHTHTPMGSVVTRLAAKKARKKYHTRVIYTAHGFHFYKGAPKLYWMLFYPVEKHLSKYTDTLILINQEDYNLAKTKFKKCKDIQYVPGVGIDESKFNFKMTDKEKTQLRKSLGLSKDDFVMIYVARLDKNKNQGFLIDATRELIKTNPNIHLVLVGPDEFNGKYQEQAKDILNNVHFTGLRKDIPELLSISNIAVSSSLREGLGLNLIEAGLIGLPLVAYNNRGHKEIIKNDNGIMFNTLREFIENIIKIKNCSYDKQLIKESVDCFLLKNVKKRMNEIYNLDNKKENTLYSIIVPAYNSENNIENCIKSIINQTYGNFELIIVNDGSDDSTLDICLKYKKEDKRIKIINQNNSGVMIARSNGIKNAKGKYILFCDSDDELCRDTLILINKIFEECNPDIINYKWTRKLNRLNPIFKGEYLSKKEIINKIFPILLENKNGIYFSPSICDMAFKKELYIDNEVKNKKIEIGEDLACKKAMLYSANSIYLSDAILYYYRDNNNSVTRSKKVFLWNGPELIGKHIESKININNFDFKNQINRVITHQLFLVVKSQFNRKDNYRNIKKEIIVNLNNSYYKEAISKCKYSPFYIKGNLARLALRYKLILIIYIFSKLK